MPRDIRGKPPAEVGESSGPVTSAVAQAEAGAEASHQRAARTRRPTRRRTVLAGTAEPEAECGAKNTGPESAN